MEYTVIIHKDEKRGWYTGKCVQVPGAMSQGKTLDELMENMKDAIRISVESRMAEIKKRYEGQDVFYMDVVIP